MMPSKEPLNTVLRHLLEQELREMPQPSVSEHVADDDELLLRWEIDAVSFKERREVVGHLQRCPRCLNRIGEMVQAGVLTLPEPIHASAVTKRRKRLPLRRCLVASLLLLWMVAVSWSVFGPIWKDQHSAHYQVPTQGEGIPSIGGNSISLVLRPTVCIRQEQADGTLELLVPAKWAQNEYDSVFLDRIVVYGVPESPPSMVFQWIADEAKADWTLTLLHSPFGFTLTRNKVGLLEPGEIDALTGGGFKVIGPLPQTNPPGTVAY